MFCGNLDGSHQLQLIFPHDCIEKYSRSTMLGFLVATWEKNKHATGSWNACTGLFNGRMHRIGVKHALHVLVGKPQQQPLGLHNFWMHQHKWLQQMLLPQRRECVSVGRNGSLLKVGSGLHVCHSKPGGHYCCTQANRCVFLLILNSRATACNQGNMFV